ncbi:MAG: hypothetical protein F6K10_18365 [Moorea sp. SIO2B7]|nr:hypothetical protein [Moorena sp. SIO2B7]
MLIINEQGKILDFKITHGNGYYRGHVPTLTQSLWKIIFGEQGYIYQKLKLLKVSLIVFFFDFPQVF